MSRLSFTVLMNRLEEESAQNIREKFLRGRRYFIPRDNTLAKSLLDIIAMDKVTSILTNGEFGLIMDSVFPNSFFDIHYLSRYCDLLIRTCDCLKTQIKPTALCEMYNQEFLYRVQNLKRRLATYTNPEDNELWQEMIDIYKFATIMHKQYSGQKASFIVTRQEMEFFENTLRSNQVAQNIVQRIDPFRQDEREFAVLLSWILIEMICEQDCI